jgi:hypothetical protein
MRVASIRLQIIRVSFCKFAYAANAAAELRRGALVKTISRANSEHHARASEWLAGNMEYGGVNARSRLVQFKV